MPKKHPFLFLDRDGVINERLPGRYVQKVEEFQFTNEALKAFSIINKVFDRIVVITNQQGIGKGVMSEEDLSNVHHHMRMKIEEANGRVDGIYFCPELAGSNPDCRKPNPGMAFQVKADFPEIDFSKSVMVGDSISDMLFGKRLGMKTVMIKSNPDQIALSSMTQVDMYYESLYEFATSLTH